MGISCTELQQTIEITETVERVLIALTGSWLSFKTGAVFPPVRLFGLQLLPLRSINTTKTETTPAAVPQQQQKKNMTADEANKLAVSKNKFEKGMTR